MMFTTIPLKSLLQDRTRCISCDKKIYRWVKMCYTSNRSDSILVDSHYCYSSRDVDNIDGHVYDYKCASCISDRDYNMTDRYNITHPIREDNLLSWIDVKSPHITVKGIISEHNKGDKVNQ